MSNERSVKFRYIFSKDYNPVYCNGAYGGISPQGDIVANFFLERLPLPNFVTNSINSDGTLSGNISKDPEDLDNTFIRYVTNGIVLNEVGARAIYEWLGTQLAELENRKKTSVTVEETDTIDTTSKE